jgi:hypothetical protein
MKRAHHEIYTIDEDFSQRVFESPVEEVCQGTKRLRLDRASSPVHLTVNLKTGSCIYARAPIASCTSPERDSTNQDPVTALEYEQHGYHRDSELVQHHRRRYHVNPRIPQAYDEKHRATCAEWLNEVAEAEKMSTIPVHVGCLLMDRFLSLVPTFPRSRYQLLAAACFCVSAKREEVEDYIPTFDDWVMLCAGQFTKKDFVQMEILLLNILEWEIAEVTPIHFLDYYLQRSTKVEDTQVVPLDHLRRCCEFLIDLCLIDRKSLQAFVPSKIAASAISTARSVLGLSSWNHDLSSASWYTINDVEECCHIMLEYYSQLNDEGQS